MIEGRKRKESGTKRKKIDDLVDRKLYETKNLTSQFNVSINIVRLLVQTKIKYDLEELQRQEGGMIKVNAFRKQILT